MGKMGTISKQELSKLFGNIDSKLKKQVDIYVIGGAAAILGYDVVKETNDVDLDGRIDSEFGKLFAAEAARLKLDLYLSSKGIFSPPHNYRERMHSEIFRKKRLRVWYLDQYDLAISKIDRGIEKDFEDIKRVHQKSPFEMQRLVQIFRDEYINIAAIGNSREKMMNLLDLISMLFGDEAMVLAQRELQF
jgi:hypothetical protein